MFQESLPGKNSSQVRSNIILYSQQSILAFQITYLPLARQIISHPLSQLLISNNWHLRTVSYSSEITLSFSFLEKKEKTGKKRTKRTRLPKLRWISLTPLDECASHLSISQDNCQFNRAACNGRYQLKLYYNCKSAILWNTRQHVYEDLTRKRRFKSRKSI